MASETTKIEARQRFLLCFRPDAMDESLTSDRRPCSGEKVFAYIPVADKGDLKNPTILPPLTEKEKESSKVYARRTRKRARRIFSAIVNAFFFDTKLKKKLRNRKMRQDPYRPDCSQVTKTSYVTPCPKISEYDDRNSDLLVRSPSSSSSSLCSSTSISRSSTTSSSSASGRTLSCSNWEKSSRSNSLEAKQNDRSVGSIQSNLQEPRQKTKKKKKRAGTGLYSSCYGLLLIVISFAIVIFWGRLCAILCTSTWLYLAPRRDPDSNLPEDTDSSRL